MKEIFLSVYYFIYLLKLYSLFHAEMSFLNRINDFFFPPNLIPKLVYVCCSLSLFYLGKKTSYKNTTVPQKWFLKLHTDKITTINPDTEYLEMEKAKIHAFKNILYL